MRDNAELVPYLEDAHADFVALRARDLEVLPPAARARLVPIGRFGGYRLLQEPQG